MIECKITGVDVSIEKNKSQLLGPVSFELANSNCTIVLGPNGAGKTSLLRLLHGLDKPTTGSITWDSRETAIAHQTLILPQTV